MSELQPQQQHMPGGLYASLETAKLRVVACKIGLPDEPFALSDGEGSANVWLTRPNTDGSEVGIIADIDDKGIWVGHVPTSDLLPQLDNPYFNPSTHEASILYHANYPALTMEDAVRYVAGPVSNEAEPERVVSNAGDIQQEAQSSLAKISLSRLEEAFVFAAAVMPPRLSKFLVRIVMRGAVRQLEEIPVPVLPG